MMNKRTILVSLFASIVIVIGVGYILKNPHSDTKPTAEAENPLYQLTFPDTASKDFNFRNLKGKITVVNFWATWCGPCQDEMPEMSSLSEEYKAKGVQFVGIAADELINVQDFLESTKVAYPLVIAEYDALSISATLGNKNGVLPYTIIIDESGKILDAHAGRIVSSNMRSILDRALMNK